MKRKSVSEHKLQGTYRADRHNRASSKNLSSATAPKFLSKIAKQEWNRVTPLLADQGILAEIDQSMLASYCQMFAHWRASEDDIAKNGLVILVESQTRTGRTVKPVQNPAVRNSIQFHKAMAQTGVKFGLSPLDRPRITLPLEDEDDPNGMTTLHERPRTPQQAALTDAAERQKALLAGMSKPKMETR